MNPAPSPFTTRTLDAPPGHEAECGKLDIYDRGDMLISAWEPSADELAALNAGGKVWLAVYTRRHPMVAIGAGETCPEFARLGA